MAKKILPIWQDGFKKLIETENVNEFACDIYWNKIQKDNKMFIFKHKFGYQRPSFSSISKSLTYNLD